MKQEDSDKLYFSIGVAVGKLMLLKEKLQSGADCEETHALVCDLIEGPLAKVEEILHEEVVEKHPHPGPLDVPQSEFDKDVAKYYAISQERGVNLLNEKGEIRMYIGSGIHYRRVCLCP